MTGTRAPKNKTTDQTLLMLINFVDGERDVWLTGTCFFLKKKRKPKTAFLQS
jgi:hypothetical protein